MTNNLILQPLEYISKSFSFKIHCWV